ncbi:50S ribosomal protein L22, partial (plasmid) [Borrelia miyamotoi]
MFVNRRYTARGKNLPSSPQKVRPIADNIRR